MVLIILTNFSGLVGEKSSIVDRSSKRLSSRHKSVMFPLVRTSRNSLIKLSSKGLGFRFYSLTPEEASVREKLVKALEPERVEVVDVSGGCGSMFAIDVTSAKFKGLSIVKQHKLVNQILKEDIQKWHGLQLRTKSN